MSFTTYSTTYSVADYIGRITRRELVVNRDYQRTPEVWPTQARSFLIESIILGYPVPKLYIRERFDPTTRVMKSEIIDGQQRSMAIMHYLEGKYAISPRSEITDARGLRFNELDPEYQRKISSYILSADVLSGASDDEVVELFRRINSHTVSLNPEEQRHAQFQGEMKWFVYELSRDLGPSMEKLGVFGPKQMARMQDAKFYADVMYALAYGIKTTSRTHLDDLYKKFDKEFEMKDEVKERFERAMSVLVSLEPIHGTRLVKHYNFYSLLLAVMHVQGPVHSLLEVDDSHHELRDEDELVTKLLRLDSVLEEEEVPAGRQYAAFWTAAKEKTNTKDNRVIRFKTFIKAIAQV